MFETLIAKTFAILGLQLFVTWATTVLVIRGVRKLYYDKTPGITAITNEDGLLDFDIEWELIKPYFYILLIVDITVFLFLLFKGTENLLIGIPLFTFWSMLTGIELAFALISVDENLGGKVLAITATITFLCTIIGMKSGFDFSPMGRFLFASLTLLIIANLVRLFVSIPRNTQRIIAFIGCLIFTCYLLYDFNRLARLNEKVEANTWSIAMHLSINIYLDIINLFLDLLDLLSK